MKRIFYISVLLTLCCLPMAAQLNGTGYYRFRNAHNTTDYISMTNDKFNYLTAISTACGGLSQAMSSAGQARGLECAGKFLATDIHLVEDADCINPATIIYAKKKNTNNSNYDYNLIGQGTSLLTLTTGTYDGTLDLIFKDVYCTINSVSGTGANTLYTAKFSLKASNNSLANLGTRYLVDDNNALAINTSNSATNARWYIEPVTHFNVLPEVTYNNKYYTTLYVPFAFKLSGQVETAYVVSAIGEDGTLALETVASNGETVPAGTPVLLECGSNSVSECQLIPTDIPLFTEPQNVSNANAPAASTATSYSGTNLLKGNYYCNQDGAISFSTPSGTSSFNANHFTSSTANMYSLGITASGKLGMVKVTPTGTAMPANKAWIEYSGSAELVFPFTASTPGDVNRDGNVDALDIMAVINIIRGRDEGFNYDYDAADVNEDNDYSVLDINAIINIIRRQ